MERPSVGVACIVKHHGKVLYGKRRTDHGEGKWCVPGGKLEQGESIEDCARREVAEETGLEVEHVERLTVTNDIFSEEKHYITVWVTADAVTGDYQKKEPEKFEEWRWVDWDDPPRPLFLPDVNLRERSVLRYNDRGYQSR